MTISKKELNEIAAMADKAYYAFPKEFLKKWCEARGVPYEIITARNSRAAIVRLRKEALLAFIAQYPNMSYVAVSKIFGRNHTTILSMLGRLKKNKVRVAAKRQLELPL
jgi:chromosomal replication initiation ATPase DnaA